MIPSKYKKDDFMLIRDSQGKAGENQRLKPAIKILYM